MLAKECAEIISTILSYRNYFREFAIWTLKLVHNLGLRKTLNPRDACLRLQCKCVIRDSEKVYSQRDQYVPVKEPRGAT